MRAFWPTAFLLLASIPAQAQTALPAVIHPEAPVSGRREHVPLGPDGHYRVQALVNGVTLPMLFDTGATTVALRAEDASRLGIDPASLTYSLTMTTANGRTRAAPVILRSIGIGGITRHNVAATVSQPGRLAENLLGQSFLSRLSGYSQEGRSLIFVDLD